MSSQLDMKKDRSAMEEIAEYCHCAVEEVEDLYPCTPLQEGMMAITFKDPAAYTVEYEYRLPSDVEPQRFREAWTKVAQANPILRTRIVSTMRRGCVQVVVRRTPPWKVQRSDQSQGPSSVVSWKMGEPLVRFTLESNESDQCIFRVLLHHALCEDWSMLLLLHQVEAAYNGEMLTPRPFRPFIEHIEKQRPEATRYWTETFKNADKSEMKAFPSLPEAGYHPRPTTTMYHNMVVDSDQDTSFSLNSKMRLSWAILQSLYTGSTDTLFGAIDSGRGMAAPGIESVSGPTLACVPVHIALNLDDPVVDALEAIRTQWLTEMDFGQIGLQNLLHMGAGPAAACQFQTLLAVDPRDTHSGPRMFSAKKETQKVYDTYPFILRCRPSQEGVALEAHCDPAVITARQTERIFQQLENIYQQVNKVPEITLRDINTLSQPDASDLTSLNLPLPPAASQTVHGLIQKSAQKWPDALAVSSWDGDMSYNTLDNLSSLVAAQILARGVQRGRHVAVCVEKGKWMSIAMLSVMKAGGTFVLLDPSHPPARLNDIWGQLDAELILASKVHAEVVLQLPGQVCYIDELSAVTERNVQDTDQLLPLVSFEDPVYVTFTSGSTGKPKGAVSHHDGFASSALAHGKLYGITSESRVLQFASPAFDSCIIEHLTTLMFGGCVCIPTASDCHSSLANAISRFEVNLACLTPTVARILSPNTLPTLKSLVFVGEAVLPSDVTQWEQFVNVRNAYGPAECSAVFSVQPALQRRDASNIGFPTGCVGWIVHPDDHSILMPIGCPGELLIEGPTVGRGYLKNPEQTHEVFIAAPSWRQRLGNHGRLMYKTGDLVQYAQNGDGSICYLGRKGTQVKFHGQRIEMADIEHHLRSAFPNAQQVIAEKLTIQDSFLAAFIYLPESIAMPLKQTGKILYDEPSEDFRQQCTGAQDILSKSLPNFMIPRVFLPVANLPLTASSKTDRRALRAHMACLSWDQLQSYRGSSAAPRRESTNHELILQNIWAHVLNRAPEEMDINESFFRLGGDSVSAMQISASCQSAGFKMTVANIMEFPTIAELAGKMQTCSSIPSASAISRNNDQELTERWFELSPIQQLFFEKTPEGHDGFTQQFLLRLLRPMQTSQIQQAMDLVVQEHSMLRAYFQPSQDGKWRQAIPKFDPKHYVFRDHSIPSPETSVLQTILGDSQRTMDIRAGRVLVVDVINTTQEQYLSIMAHHLVIDLVSWRVLLQDLEDILTSGSISGLPSLSFQPWCRIQQLYSQECLDPSTSIPSDIPSPPSNYWGTHSLLESNAWGETHHESISISEDATRAILGSCNDAFHTRPVEVIHTAILFAFSKIFEDRVTPTIFSEGHGREPWDPEIDIARTIGWFTTMVPFFVDAKSAASVAELLVGVKERRRYMPSNGWEYFASRYGHEDGPKYCESHEPMEILFNYTGLFQQLERSDALLQLATLPDHDLVPIPSDLPRFALIDVSATVMEGRLLISFWYNQHMDHTERLQKWIHECEKVLEYFPAALQQTGHFTLSDFPLLSLQGETSLKKLIDEINTTCHVPQGNIQDICPLSPIQLGMWLSQLKDPDVYWSHMEWFIRPSSNSVVIDPVKCRDAWQTVINRHSILRTIFTDETDIYGQPLQVVLRKATANVDLNEAMPLDCVEDWTGKALHKISLTEQADGSVRCHLSIHHMLVDGTTRHLLLSDFREAYDGQIGSDDSGVPYSSFLTYLRDKDSSGPVNHWKRTLQGVHPSIFPPLDTEDIDQQALHSVPLKFPFSQNLQKFCRQRGITISNLFQVAWGLVLRAYTGSDAVCFGFLASGRDIPLQDAHRIAGPLINLLICRLTLDDDATIKSTLVNNQAAYARNLGNQHFALADVVHSLGLSGRPLFNTALSLQKENSDPDSTYGHASKLDFVGGRDHTEYPLTVNLAIGSHDIHGDLTYRGEILSDRQAEFVADAFQQAAAQILNPENTSISDIELLGSHNQAHLMKVNFTVPAPAMTCIHTKFHENALANPTANAVDAWDGGFTYGELDVLSSNLAQFLIHYGIDRETFVPICCDKTRWGIVAILAVLKSGGAFILMDPSHPLDRLQDMLRGDFDCSLVLTSSSRIEKAMALAPNTIAVDDEKTWANQSHDASSMIDVTPDTAAYAIFTSGSTGKPKASIIEHQSFLSAAEAHCKVLGLSRDSRVLQFASHAFDASIVEILSTLLAGGCVCIPSDSDRQSRLQKSMQSLLVTWTLLTPSVARLLSPQDLPSLNTLVLGGEGMGQDDVERWSPHVQLMNAYGPSECSVIATAQPSSHALTLSPANIGHPVGANAWVVHPKNLNIRIPIGAIGELVIEGPIVGRGYRNRPLLMETAYPRTPEWLQLVRGTANCPIYCTGDLVRYLPDGSIRYLGRKDRQVKLNGQRLELHEVEHNVQRCFPGAAEVFASMVKLEDSGSTYLVASVHMPSSSPDEPDFATMARQAKSLLEAEVPGFLVPAAIFPLFELPKMPNGKVNLAQIRDDATTSLKSQGFSSSGKTNYIADKELSPTECCVRKLWSKVLRRPATSIGPDDHFFRLGGDSVGVMKVAATANAEGLQITAGDIFLHPVLCELAGIHVQSLSKKEANEPLSPFSLLQPQDHIEARAVAARQCQTSIADIEDIYPCTTLQAGLVALTAEKSGAYVAQHRYQLPEDIDLDQLKEAWQRTSDVHPILRTRVIEMPDLGCLQVVIRNPDLGWTLTQEDGLEDLHESGSIFGKPLVRLNILDHRSNEENPGSCSLVLMMHHALYDAWSLPQLVDCAKMAYQQPEQELVQPAPFQRFVKHTISHSESALEAWREHLKNTSATPFPSVPSPTYRPKAMRRKFISLDTGPFAEHSVTKSTAIAFSWAMVQAQYQSNDDVIFGIVSTGRRAPVLGIERMTGPTIATLPLRVTLNSNETVSQGLESLQAHMARMVLLEQAGLSKISRLGPDGELACSFQTLLNIESPSTENKEKSGTFMEHVETTAGKGAFSTYALHLTCTMKSDTVDVEALFDDAVLPPWQMQCILDQFSHILHHIASVPECLLQDIPALNNKDRQQLQRWNPHASRRIPAAVPEMVSQHFNSQPLAPAVTGWDGSWSYQELESLAGRLVTVLDRHGVGPESLVPIYMERSTWTIIAMFGVMQAGAAFVLLDTSHPFSRLQTICNEIEPSVILTGRETVTIGQQLALKAIIIGADTAFVKEDPTECSERSIQPDQPLYAVFTSGSTGQPKGVVIEHGSFITMAVANAHRIGLDHTSRLLQVASYAFDVSIGEMLGTLITGGCICILSDSERREGLPQAVSRMQPTHAIFTPSVLRVWSPSDLQGIKTVVITGEAARQGDIKQWADKVQLINNYGPAECTVFFTSQGPLGPDSAATNIGFPLVGNAWIAHREDPNRPIPLGAVGELLLQGPLVGRGYLHNPDQTAAAFVPCPQWVDDIIPEADATSARVYRTGDLARFESDGSILYLGRRDCQVKLRGQRFELSEVEDNIQRHFPGKLRDVIAEVVTPAGRVKAPCLVAFLLPDQSKHKEQPSTMPSAALALELAAPPDFETQISTLKTRQKETLPDYMIPSAFIPLAEMPRTVGGKADRRRLRDAAMQVSRQELESFAPTAIAKEAVISEDQRLLQGIWSRTLGLSAKDIGADDSFFRLGGDSISALQATSQARAQGVLHAVADLFRLKTIRKIALEFPSSPDVAPNAVLPEKQTTRKSGVTGVGYPCTPAQRAILLSQAQDSKSYAPQFVWHVSAKDHDVDVHRLAKAWQMVVRRHPALRVTFHPDESQNDYFEQMVSEVVDAPVSIVPELTDVPPDMPRPITSLGQIPHHLTIYRTPSSDVICCLDINHAVIDATSISIVERDMRHAYHHGDLNSHGETYKRYLDLALQCKPEPAHEYFASYLAGINSPALLPRPWSSPFNQTSDESRDNMEQLDLNLSSTKSDVESLCCRTDWTLPNLLYFAWALTLSSFTGSKDVCFGSFTSGRHFDVPYLVDAVGQFSNMSVCRVCMMPDSTLDEAALNLQEHYGNVLAHQTFPLISIARAAQVTMDEIALTAINVQYADSAVSHVEGEDSLNFKTLKGRDPTIQDVVLYVLVEETGKLRVCMSYRLSHVSTELATQLVHFFDTAISVILHKKQGLIRNLEILNASDEKLLRSWNPPLDPPKSVCIHHFIQTRAMKQPSEIAVSGWDGELTYGELEELSTRAAAGLIARGCKPGDRIPLCFEKSRWAIVAILAVMKIGATFVPLDPTHPVFRLQESCRRLQAGIVLCSVEQEPLGRELAPEVIILPNTSTTISDVISGVNQAGDPEQAAYILFTSGSTGVPKGVVISHSAFVHAADAQIQAFSLHSGSCVLQFSSYAFDVAVMEILTTLIAGGTVCVISEPERSQMMLKGVCPHEVTHAFLTPSLASSLDPARASWLQTLVLLGEPVSAAHISQWHGVCRLINAYGPTEGSVINTSRPELSPSTDASNIGWPMGVHCWVVDPHDHENLLPLGAIGELILCGPSVAHGYLDQKRKTKESFPEAPQWLRRFYPEIPASWRLYKTGDLVRHDTTDGSLRFEGRKDEQVKVRGQRIELGDIEYHAKRSFPGAREVVVDQVALPERKSPKSPDHFSTPRLIAWVYMGSESSDSTSASLDKEVADMNTLLEPPNRTFRIAAATALTNLREALPSYMVPEVFLSVSRVPLVKSGKTDRRQLKEATSNIDIAEFGGLAGEAVDKEPAQNQTETTLHSILVDLLELEPEVVGVEDSFFHLGGDSILAMKVAAHARGKGLKINSHDILRHPTIRQWGQLVDNSKEQSSSKSKIYTPFSLVQDSDREAILSRPLVTGTVEDILPALESQAYYIRDSSPVSYVHLFSEALDLCRLKNACLKAVSEYSNLRSMFVSVADQMFQVVLRNAEPVFDFVEDHDPEAYMAQLSRKKLVPATVQGEMPVRFTIVTAADSPRWVFIVHLSHAQYDGGCLAFLWQAIGAAYAGHDLPSVTDFRQLVHHRRGCDNRDSLAFWTKYLSGAGLSTLDPLDIAGFPGPADKDTFPRQVRREIPKPSLLAEITVANLVKAALSWVLARNSSRSDIVLGQVVHGRGGSLPGIDKVFGPCVTFLPIRILINSSWTVADLLQHVQTQQLATIPHDSVSLSDIAMQSTNWGADAKYGVLVHHQGLGSHGWLEIDGVASSSSAAWGTSRAIPGQVTIFSVEQETSLDLMIAGPVDALDEGKAESLADELAKAIELFSTGLNLPLTTLGLENQSI